MHDTLYFRMKRIERLSNVLLGRMGVWKVVFPILKWMENILEKVSKKVK
jgi:hypothetical protein